jgi:hypothetical protein
MIFILWRKESLEPTPHGASPGSWSAALAVMVEVLVILGTTQAQARDADDAVHNSGTEDGIPRCLRPFISQRHSHLHT